MKHCGAIAWASRSASRRHFGVHLAFGPARSCGYFAYVVSVFFLCVFFASAMSSFCKRHVCPLEASCVAFANFLCGGCKFHVHSLKVFVRVCGFSRCHCAAFDGFMCSLCQFDVWFLQVSCSFCEFHVCPFATLMRGFGTSYV